MVAKSGGGYAATSPQVPGAEPFFFKPTELGQYMVYGRARDYLARDAQGNVVPGRRLAARTPTGSSRCRATRSAWRWATGC